jgi:hypothetical protein
MDRLRRVLAGGTAAMMLGTVVAAAGCRSMRNEVPPGPSYPATGEPSSSMGFNSAPRPYSGTGSAYANSPVPGQPGAPGMSSPGGSTTGSGADGMPSGLGSGGSSSSFGTPSPSSSGLGQPTTNLYGGPGTSGSSGTGR